MDYSIDIFDKNSIPNKSGRYFFAEVRQKTDGSFYIDSKGKLHANGFIMRKEGRKLRYTFYNDGTISAFY